MAGWASITTPVGGTAISSSAFGIPVATDLGILANPPRVRAYQSAATTSLTSGTVTAIGFDAEDAQFADPQGLHSTTTNNSRFTVPSGWAGVYSYSGIVTFAGNATGARTVGVGINGVTPINGSENTEAPGNTTQTAVLIADEVFLNVGDYLQLLAVQNSGSTLATVIALPFTSRFTVTWRSLT